MPADSLDELIAAIRARGEPIDFESLLNWPTPVTDLEGFHAAAAAFASYKEVQVALERDREDVWRDDPVAQEQFERQIEETIVELEKRRADAGSQHLSPDFEHMSDEQLKEWMRASDEGSEKSMECASFWRLVSLPSHDYGPKIPFIDEKPELDRALVPEDWRIVAEYLERFATPLEKLLAIRSRVDWRPGIKAESYFDDASEYHEAHHLVGLLCLAAIWRGLRLGQNDWDKYLTSAAHLGAAASSIRLLMSHIAFFAGFQRIVDTIGYILHHVTASPETVGRLVSTIALFDDEHMLERIYIGERVFGLADDRSKLSPDQRVGDWWMRLDEECAPDARYYLANMARLIDIARLPLQERLSTWTAFMQEPGKTPVSEGADSAINPTAKPALPLNLIMLTKLRLLKTALIFLNDGHIDSAKPASLPQDPFCRDAGTIRYREIDAGFIVYSVGLDQVDSGGSTELMDDYGPLWRMIQRRLQTKDIVLTVTRRHDVGVSLVWS